MVETPRPAPSPEAESASEQAVWDAAQSVSANLARGLGMHQQGQLVQARAVYERVLSLVPDHFDALHLLGALSVQTGEFADAEQLLDKAVRLSPNHVRTWRLLGLSQLKLRNYGSALDTLERALTLDCELADVWVNHGLALVALERHAQALSSFESAVALDATIPQAFYHRGNVQCHLAQYAAAIESHDQAIALNPTHGSAYFGRAVAQVALDRLPDAATSYDRAVEFEPDLVEAHFNRGCVMEKLGRLQEAVASYDQAVVLAPELSAAHFNRANVLVKLDQCDASLTSYACAIAIKPAWVEAYYNLGNALQRLLRLDEAVQSYQQAIALDPHCATAHWNQALCWLAQGDYARGLEKYEWRWQLAEQAAPLRHFSQPKWLGGESLAGKTILLHMEQGLGDVIQVCRYVIEVARLGARVILEVPQPLIPLLTTLPIPVELIALGEPLPSFDYHCPLMSLPLAFGARVDQLPHAGGYLRAVPDKLVHWQRALGPTGKCRVGLVWGCNTTHSNSSERSMPLREMLGLMTPQLQFVSLQKEPTDPECELMRQTPELVPAGAQLMDFADTAALCQLLDVVVTVDTSVAHVAGALGRPVWVLLPYHADWRWMHGRADSPWYASARLFRQESPGDWVGVVQKVAAELQRLVQ